MTPLNREAMLLQFEAPHNYHKLRAWLKGYHYRRETKRAMEEVNE